MRFPWMPPSFPLHFPSCPIISSSWPTQFLSMCRSLSCPFPLDDFCFISHSCPLHFQSFPYISLRFSSFPLRCLSCPCVSPTFPLHFLFLSPSFPIHVRCISNHFPTSPFMSCSFPLHFAFISPSCLFYFPLISCHFRFLCMSLHVSACHRPFPLNFPHISPSCPFISGRFALNFLVTSLQSLHVLVMPPFTSLHSSAFPHMSPSFPLRLLRFLFVSLRFPFISYVFDVGRGGGVRGGLSSILS